MLYDSANTNTKAGKHLWFSKASILTTSMFLLVIISSELQQVVSAQNAYDDENRSLPPSASSRTYDDGTRVAFMVPPGLTDSRIQQGDGDNVIFFNRPLSPNAYLLIFIGAAMKHARENVPGFDLGKALSTTFAYPFLNTAANLGYRVIYLDYKYDPAGTVLCEGRKMPCYECFREQKMFGTNDDLMALKLSNIST